MQRKPRASEGRGGSFWEKAVEGEGSWRRPPGRGAAWAGLLGSFPSGTCSSADRLTEVHGSSGLWFLRGQGARKH